MAWRFLVLVVLTLSVESNANQNNEQVPYKLQPEDPGCYESDCPPGCQLVLIPKEFSPHGGLYYGIPAEEFHIAVSSNTRLYKSTGQTAVGADGDFALTFYLFHHRELNMWVIAEGEDALRSVGSEKIVVQSGVSGSSVIPSTGYEQWTWEKILPYCMDMDSDNFCKYEGYKPDEASRSLMHKSYPFSEGEDGNDGRQVTAAAPAIYAHMGIPPSSGLANGKESGSATSWELRMDIRVTHSTNGTYFMTVGWYPGGYSGIQQTPDTKHVPSGKNFLFSMWDTNTDNHGNADGGIPRYSYVHELNDKADVGGQVGVINNKFGGEGTGQKIQIDYPWAIGDTTTAFIRGSRASLDSDEWCVASGLAPPGKEEVFLARFCRRSPEGVLQQSGFHVFIEDFLGPTCPATGNGVGFMKQRAAVFSNWKVIVDGKEVATAAPRFTTVNGHARGLTDAGMLGDKAFYISVGGWKYNNPYNP